MQLHPLPRALTTRSRSSCSIRPTCATTGCRRCGGSSSSSASTRASSTRSSSRSATRPRARSARPGSGCGCRTRAARAAARRVPRRAWLGDRRRAAAFEADREADGRRRGARPRGARGPARGRGAAARPHRARLRALVGLSPRRKPGRGTGAALGTQVLRYSGIHTVGMVAANALTFAAVIVIANFSEPAEFGQLGLLMFYSGLLTLLFTLASKQGTLKRTFGGDDDDDDDEDDEELSSDSRRSLGTGLITIAVVSAIGVALSVVVRPAARRPPARRRFGPDPDRLRGARRRRLERSSGSRRSRSGSSVAPTRTSPPRRRGRSSPSPRSCRC